MIRTALPRLSRFRAQRKLRGESLVRTTPRSYLRARARRTIRAVSSAVLTAAMISGGLFVQPVAAAGVVGNGFTVTPADLAFILKQIKIAEEHAIDPDAGQPVRHAGRPARRRDPGYQIPDRLTSYGLRTVDGSCNNLFPGRENVRGGRRAVPATDQAGASGLPRPSHAGFFGPGSPADPASTYAQKKGFVFDSQPRLISNLIVDQTSTNPAAVAAAAFPVRTQGNPGLFPCTTDPDPRRRPGRGRPGGLRAVAPDAVHPERDHRRRPLAAVQLAVHVLRPVLRPRRRPDRQERRHRVRPAARRRPAGHPRAGRQAQHR